MGATITGITPGDDIGRDPPLAIGWAGQRNEAPLTGRKILDLNDVANSEDMRVTSKPT